MVVAPEAPAQPSAAGSYRAAPAGTAERFRPLDLPAPNAFRTASGEPGPGYWQQRADYHIRATLEPVGHRITGSVVITYTNNSPDTLRVLWLQLDQNLFRPGSRGNELQPAGSRWRGGFAGGGYTLGRLQTTRNGRTTNARYLVDDTRLRVELDEPLPGGGGRIDVAIDYSFAIPRYGADRMGRFDAAAGPVYEIAQWYPRFFVYDDVSGWNTLPYLGQGEFYLEYGDFDVELTVPREYLVVATGTLMNAPEVLTPEQQRRLDRARRSAETVMIVDRHEVGREGSRPRGSGDLTWKFHAERVRDFAWAASPAFIWDAAGWEGVLIQSAYPKEGLGSGTTPGWEQSTQYARHAIRHYSERWFRYPYPVAVNVAGVVGGMEYPMVAFCSVNARGQGLFGVTDHELGHNWFPMIVGSNERRHAWMDEGFNTFINHHSFVDFYDTPPTRTENLTGAYIASMMRQADPADLVATEPDRMPQGQLGFLAYRKPGKGLALLREHILGPERFDMAFHEYIRRWAFRHPQPADFFRTIENIAGEDLSWFWRGWFYTTEMLDQRIEHVATQGDGLVVTLSNRPDGLVMPVDLAITRADGRTERRRIPVEVWAVSDRYQAAIAGTDVAAVVVDPDGMLPDVDRSNNVWRATSGGVSPSADSR